MTRKRFQVKSVIWGRSYISQNIRVTWKKVYNEQCRLVMAGEWEKILQYKWRQLSGTYWLKRKCKRWLLEGVQARHRLVCKNNSYLFCGRCIFIAHPRHVEVACLLSKLNTKQCIYMHRWKKRKALVLKVRNHRTGKCHKAIREALEYFKMV